MKIRKTILLAIEKFLIYFLPIHIYGTRFPVKDYDDIGRMSFLTDDI